MDSLVLPFFLKPGHLPPIAYTRTWCLEVFNGIQYFTLFWVFFRAFCGDLQSLITEPLESIDLYEKTTEF